MCETEAQNAVPDTPGREPLAADEPEAAASGDAPGPQAQDADHQLRRRIVRRFEAWLDEVLADEAPPQGLDAEILAELQSPQPPSLDGGAEPADDLGALWSAMTALAQETKLQGRAFKQLHESLSSLESLPESVRGVVSAHGEALGAARDAARQVEGLRDQQLRQAAQAARQETETKLLNVLLDVRDRLVRGADTARRQLAAAPRAIGWLGRLFHRPGRAEYAAQAAQALLEGCTLSLDRLEESLAALGVQETPCQGQPFDPGRMMAAAVEQTQGVPQGTVVEVFRAGYQWHGRVHRLAEVKVARRPKGDDLAAAGQEKDGHERT